MKKLLFGIAMISFALACQSENKVKIAEPASVAIIENNLYAINGDGTNAPKPQTILSRMKELNVPGLSIAVFDNNEILWAKGYGLKDKYLSLPVDANTIFQAASISKPVASVAAFKLVEEGKLALNEDVNLKLKRWHVPNNEFAANEKVTIARIMSHTSGLSTSGFDGYHREAELPTLVQILQGNLLTNSEPVRVFQEPGKSEYYSGGGMTVLQMLLEDVSGKSFSKLLSELVLEPVGMIHSSFEYPLSDKFNSLTANGYDENEKMIEGGYHLYPEKAAAGLWTTPSDLARFMIALGHSYRGEKNGLIKQSSAKKMMTRVPGAGGMGIGIDGEGVAFRFRHSGGNAGFSCYAVSFAEKGRGIVLMTNSDNGYSLNHELARTIAKEYNWSPMWPRE